MARWTNENKWNTEVADAALRFGIPQELIRAVIGQESAFVPSATRREAALSDQSIGLMQILYSTAKGEGYTGPVGDKATLTGLYDPATNIFYGASYLASQLARANGFIPAGVSAYNGGWRPEIGFGAVATKPLRICLARDANKQCIKWQDVAVGEYANQEYVNAVIRNYGYFQSQTQAATPRASGGVSPPLSVAHHDDNESEIGGHSSGSANRTPWTQIREALKWFYNLLRQVWGTH